jgi:hypothetical protein
LLADAGVLEAAVHGGGRLVGPGRRQYKPLALSDEAFLPPTGATAWLAFFKAVYRLSSAVGEQVECRTGVFLDLAS